MEGVLQPSVGSILKFTLLYSIRRNISYLIKYRSYLEELELRVRNLEVLSHNLEREVANAKRNEAEIPAEVQMWLKDVADLLLEKDKLLELYSGRPFHRYKFSREARKMIRKILILARGVHFDRISDLNMLVQFESRMRTLREIIQLLEDNRIGIVMVHGMSGVGKTTLVKEVGRYAVELGLFDVVVWSVVSQVPDVSKIQDEIADVLGFGLDNREDQLGRAFKIFQMLSRSDDSDERDVVQVLIILDDCWSLIDIDDIGIPLSNYGVRCKVLLTSRNATPVDLPMGIVPLTTLPNEEALLLFNQIVGRTVYGEYSDLAWEIVTTCEGLPLVIEAVAQELRGQPFSDWNLALQLLRRSITDFNSGILSSVKLSYDYLSDKDKFMFLLCSIFGEQIYHDDLLKYGWGLGLFEGADTVGEARSRVYNLMYLLKERSLLLEGRTSEYGKMHKIYRDFAKGVVSSDPDWFIVREDGWPIEWPEDENKMAKLTYVSLLICNDMHQLPQGLLFPNLKLLHLYDENCSSKIADGFFERTNKEGLKVLALIKMQLLSLPSSLCVLSNMDTLCLDYCVLGDISMIGELQSLRVLSLSHTNIEQLPIQIGQLIRLCMLDLSNCLNLNVIPPNLLSSLIKLEELRMENSFSRWERVDNGRSNASLAELIHLNSLSSLDIHIPDAEIIPEALPWHNLQRYNIMIGEDFQCSSEHEAFKVLKLNHNKGNIAGSMDWIESLLGSCEQLWLKEFKGLKNVLLELNGDRFGWLKHIHIQDNSELEYLPPELFIGILETLILKNLLNFREIQYRDNFQSFQYLTILKIECCPLLKSVFNISAHECLFQLREMEISGCTNMVAVANNDRDDVKLVDGHPFFDGVPWDFGFPHLHALTLQDLDNLIGFFTCVASSREIVSAEANIYSGSLFLNLVVALPLTKHLKLINIPNVKHLVASTITDRRDLVVPLQNVETMEIIGCNDLCNLFLIEGSNIDENYGGLLPELRQLCLRNLGSFRGIIGDNHPWRILNFKKLNKLTVCNCNQMKYILSLHVPNNLKLQNIDVSDCAMLEQVFVYEDTEMAESNSMVLPLLQSLKLSNLPKLASICSGSRHLISVQLYKCNSLKYVFPLSVARLLSSLQELKIISCARVGQIVTREMGVTATADIVEFPQLDTLILEKLPKFTRFCHDGCSVKWRLLEMVRVVECPKIEKSTLGKVDRPLLKSVEVIDCNPWENPHNLSNINYLFDLTDELADLTGLTIEDSDHLKKYMKMEIRDSSFAELKVLEARQCNTELTKFLSILLHRSHKLEKLTVENCKLLEQLFELGGIDKGENGKFPNLNTMRLCDLPKLNCIWNEDPSGIINLGKLVKLEIINCDILKNLLSTGFVENLVQLEELSIDSCKMIEEVVSFKVGEEKTEEQQARLFPNLKNVELVSLPNFRKFSSGNSHFRFSNLLSLRIDHCPKMEAFTTGFLSAGAPSLNSGTSEHMRDDIMDVYPKLQILKLVGLNTFEEIWQKGLFSTKSFCELKELEAHTLGNLKYIFPSSMLPKLEKLETLVVNNCSSLNNVFQLTHNMVIELPMLRNLVLSRLPTLKHVVDMNSIMVVQNLEIIKVKCCDFLRHLLLPYSSSLKLKEIEISECKILEEIFIDTQEEIRDGKVIRHLESINLENLPKLSHLPLENFEFPSLIEVRIVDCPLLNTYKSGSTEDVSSTADNFFTNKDSFEKLKKLHLINVGDCQNIWNSDLSSSSPRLKNINVGQSSTGSNRWWKLKKIIEQRSDGVGGKELLPVLDELVLSDLPNMKLWKQEPEIQVFRNLTSIEIIRCKSIQKLFSISVAENLAALELLKLYECESLQQVVQGGEKSEKHLFRNLKCLILKHLPSLTSFCKQKFDCEFTQLKMVRVENIPNMTTFIEGSLTTPKLKEVYVTHITKCWRGDLNATINYLHQNRGQLKEMIELGSLVTYQRTLENNFKHSTVPAESSSEYRGVVGPCLLK